MLTLKQINHFLNVDCQTGIITWKFHFQRPDLIGKRAGHINNGYWRLSIEGYEVYAYQVIWFVYYGVWPTFTIDHEDTISTNDSITNLRKSTKGQNNQNAKMNVRNTSGFKGVSFCRTTNKWRASIRINGTEKNLGRYYKPEEAHQAWKAAAIEAFGEEFVRANGTTN
jgi:hypothetical protein